MIDTERMQPAYGRPYLWAPDLPQHESGYSGNQRGEANRRQRKKAKLDANHGVSYPSPNHDREWIKGAEPLNNTKRSLLATFGRLRECFFCWSAIRAANARQLRPA